MSKRYLRLDIEYEFSGMRLYMVSNNIERMLSEDMPYCKVLFSRDTANREALNEPVIIREKKDANLTNN